MVNAILVVDKPAGLTSHDVVNRVRRITGERSVGHLGTLDPIATGVLPLVLGRFTRLAQFFSDSRKVYEGEIRFGFATDTYDCQGEAVGPVSSTWPSLEQVQRHLVSLTGHIQQTPPAFSAKKIHGVPAYKLARHDKVVELKPVTVDVYRFEVHSVREDRARFVAEVSAGTYIRAMAHDLGQALGCGAHLSELRRTRSGEFEMSQAVGLDEFAEQYKAVQAGASEEMVAQGRSCAELKSASAPISPTSDNEYSDKSDNVALNTAAEAPSRPSPYLHPRRILPAFPSVTASAQCIAAIRNGRSVNLPEFSEAPLVKVFAGQRLLIAVVQRVAGTLFQPRVVLFGSNEPLPL
jgi:tRNA pseudouridine55 synthase